MAAFRRMFRCACFDDDASENYENSPHNSQAIDNADKLHAYSAGVAVPVGPPAVSGAVSRQKKGKAAWVNRFLATQDNFLVSYSSRPDPDDGANRAKVLNALDLARVCDIALVPGDETGLLFHIVTAPDDAGLIGGGEHVMRAESPEMARYFVDGLMAIRLYYVNPQG